MPDKKLIDVHLKIPLSHLRGLENIMRGMSLAHLPDQDSDKIVKYLKTAMTQDDIKILWDLITKIHRDAITVAPTPIHQFIDIPILTRIF